MRIGYFAPEFPEQIFIFVWREGQTLAELGIESDWVSTRRPAKAIMETIPVVVTDVDGNSELINNRVDAIKT